MPAVGAPPRWARILLCVSEGVWRVLLVQGQGPGFRCNPCTSRILPMSGLDAPDIGGLDMAERGEKSIWDLVDAVSILFMQAYMVRAVENHRSRVFGVGRRGSNVAIVPV